MLNIFIQTNIDLFLNLFSYCFNSTKSHTYNSSYNTNLKLLLNGVGCSFVRI